MMVATHSMSLADDAVRRLIGALTEFARPSLRTPDARAEDDARVIVTIDE